MTKLSLDQRNYYYLLEAERAGIHKPILAALYQAHLSPPLTDGETGLGMNAAGSVLPERVDRFAEQVQYAANAIRSLTDNLARQGWKGTELWNVEGGRYADSFVERIADGYQPQEGENRVGRLDACDGATLLQAYLSDIETDYLGKEAPQNLAYLDRAILSLIERVPQYYLGLAHQRDAALGAVRIWRKLDSVEEASASLATEANVAPENLAEAQLDLLLKQFIQRLSPYYGGYPHQREALLRLAQLWRRLESREDAIASLAKDTSPDPGLKIYDPALVAFVERVPQYYGGSASQRNALTEVVRLWRQLDSRASALASLGIDPQILEANANSSTLQQVAAQLDRELLGFLRRIPKAYIEAQRSQRTRAGVQLPPESYHFG
ncbi:MAG: hypothetical protein SVX43_13235 [Cyanobacteriota bacterium]|nr:hypothetical protein [Cyanobacteriota bacterium]